VQHQSPNPSPPNQTIDAPASDHPDAPMLRHRADQLRRLATAIEGSLVMSLVDAGSGWDTNRARLCERMLHRNLHQLHQAADELREAALVCCRRADELDSHRIQVA